MFGIPGLGVGIDALKGKGLARQGIYPLKIISGMLESTTYGYTFPQVLYFSIF